MLVSPISSDVIFELVFSKSTELIIGEQKITVSDGKASMSMAMKKSKSVPIELAYLHVEEDKIGRLQVLWSWEGQDVEIILSDQFYFTNQHRLS